MLLIREHGGACRGQAGDQVDLAVLQGHVQGLVVVYDLQLQVVEGRRATPVVRVCDQGDLGHGGEGRGDEGAGAGHAQLGVGLLGSVIDAHQRVAQVVDDGGVRRGGDQGQHLPVRLHGGDVQRGGRAVVDLISALKAGLHGGGVHGIAVGEGHALADGELPGQLVHVLIALGDPGLGHVVLVQAEQVLGNAVDGHDPAVPARGHVQTLRAEETGGRAGGEGLALRERDAAERQHQGQHERQHLLHSSYPPFIWFSIQSDATSALVLRFRPSCPGRPAGCRPAG